ncbi:MAG: transketolase [Dehalococcoidia bacterium]
MTTTEQETPGTGSELDWRCINAIRFLSMDAVQKAKSGHPGAPMGAAPMAYMLWNRFLKHNPANPEWADRDRFVLSAGHASMLLYSLLHLTGYQLPIEQIKQFRQWGSITPGHPEVHITPGVDATTGPLGQGFANGVGMAIAERMLGATYNRPGHDIVDHHIYCIASDGDMMEGVASEAASLAGTLELGKLVCLYDDNNISIEGDTDIAFLEDVPARFRAYGWHVIGPVEGNDIRALETAIREGRDETQRPSLIVVRTTIGYGSPNKAGTASAHGEALGEEEIKLTREALGWEYPPFEVPGDVTEHMRSAVSRGQQLEAQWHKRFEAYRRDHPELAASFERDMAGDLPGNWDSELKSLRGTFDTPVASRAVSGKALAAITKNVPMLVGGSADLAGSNNTQVEGRGHFSAHEPQGRNMHFGVREHAMGAISNGMALHGGLIPYAGTFLIFSDYMRAAVRVGALSQQRVVWIYTHDSIGLGEDGPTHQPISQLMGLRLMPGMVVVRPADADETLEAWRVAMERKDGPTALILTRQALPPLASRGSEASAAGNVSRGAYIVKESSDTPDVILIGTGSEVQHALGAADILSNAGINTRVVSMPSWELFESQPDEYREHVLPRSIRARVSVEAGTKIGWEKYIGLDGVSVGMEGFGHSAPGGVTMEKFGFTAENVAQTALKLLRRQV